MAAKKKAAPKASINRPKPKPKPGPYAGTSFGGQFLVEWQKVNPGMFMPGVTMAQAVQAGAESGNAGFLQGYNPQTAVAQKQDPSWALAYLQNLAKQGKGPLAQGQGAGAVNLTGDGSEVGLSVPSYVASPELEAMRKMAGTRVGAIDEQAAYDTSQVGYRTGIGTGADESNRFSQFNLLNRAFGRTLTGLETGAASADQRFSGQYQQQLEDASFGRGQSLYDLQNTARDSTLGISRQAEQDKYGVSQSLAQGELTDRSNWYDELRKLATPKAANT